MSGNGRMTLYTSQTSPFARKVRVVAAETGADRLIDEVNVDPFQPPEEFLQHNPLSRIPVLITEQGESLPDSSLIVGYLMTRGQGLTPMPRGPARWVALRMLTLAEGIMDSAVQSTFEKRRPEGIIHTAFLDRKVAVIRRTLLALEADTPRLLSGADRPSVLEITLGVALEYLDLRLAYIEWRRDQPQLADWLAVFAQRASMIKTRPVIS